MNHSLTLAPPNSRARRLGHRQRSSARHTPAILILLALGTGCAEDIVTDVTSGTEPGDSKTVAASAGAAATAGPGVPAPLPASTGTTFYVATSGSDANPGTVTKPWKTLQKAMTTLRAGQKAYVRAGTYLTGQPFGTSSDTHKWATTCAAGAPCSLLAYPGEKPVIRGQVRIQGDYLRLSGFIIEGPLSRNVNSCSERQDNQVQVIEASYIELSHNEVRHNDYHAGISVYGDTRHIQIFNNRIHHNGRFTITNDPCTGNEVDETDHGIYWSKGVGPGNLIANNLIENNRSKGVQLYRNGTYDVLITNNTIVRNGGTGILLNGATDRITIVNNVVALNATYQIRIMKGNNNRVQRNLVFGRNPIVNATSSSVTDNQVADPRFVNQGARDWHLQTGSPGIDRALATWATATSLDGVDRPRGAAADLGAYER